MLSTVMVYVNGRSHNIKNDDPFLYFLLLLFNGQNVKCIYIVLFIY